MIMMPIWHSKVIAKPWLKISGATMNASAVSNHSSQCWLMLDGVLTAGLEWLTLLDMDMDINSAQPSRVPIRPLGRKIKTSTNSR